MRPVYLLLAVSTLALVAMITKVSILSDSIQDFDFGTQDSRVSALEQAMSSLHLMRPPGNAALNDRTQRALEVLTMDTRARHVAERNWQHCPVGLGNLMSRQAMVTAGWELNVDNEAFRDDEVLWGGHYIGWQSGLEIGKVRVRFNASGKMYLNLRNDHGSHKPEDLVTVSLNRELLAQLVSKEEKQLCIPFEPGDNLVIEEEYGIIRILGASVFCSSSTRLLDGFLSKSEQCNAGQFVYVEQRDCFRKTWVRAQLDKVLDERQAIVKLDDQPNFSASRWRMYSPSRLWLEANPAGARCSSFVFKRNPPIGLVQVADGQHVKRFQLHFQAQRCYAQARGYDFVVLDVRSWPECIKYAFWGASMFFQKHCMVRAFLSHQEPGYVAVVIDTDVVPAVLDRGVEEWLRIDADVHFYERVVFNEIAAGNYIVRNTPWGRNFLYEWSERAFKLPVGYSSYDNGAIHMLLMEKFQLQGADRCAKLYNELKVDMETWNIKADPEPYWEYAHCAKSVLGPPRTWRIDGGGVTVWPRGHFFVVDAQYVNKKASTYVGPVMHHGIKDKAELEWYFSNVGQCQVREAVLMDREKYGQMALNTMRDIARTYLGGEQEVCIQCTDECLRSLSCEPLAPDGEPRPQHVRDSILYNPAGELGYT